MKGYKNILYLIAGLLLTGIALIVFIQINSYRSIDRLVQGNLQLQEAFHIEKALFSLRQDIGVLEDKVDSILSGHVRSPYAILDAEAAIGKDIRTLHHLDTTPLGQDYIARLAHIADNKVALSKKVLDVYYTNGEDSARNYMENQAVLKLSDRITFVSHQYEASYHSWLQHLANISQRNGAKARRLNIIILVLFVMGAIGFAGILSIRIRQQYQLIDKLDNAQKQERESAAIKEKFLANMSHEIRTPLNAILGFTYLLQRHPESPETTERVGAIRKAGEDLLAIVNDILDISKIESGVIHIDAYLFSLKELLSSLQKLFAIRCADKGITLHITTEADVPHLLEGDAKRLTQILVNLVDNAVKFTSEGAVYVHVKVAAVKQDIIRLSFRVKDTGLGIPADSLPYIFDRFRQVDDASNRKHGGTGLGLSIVYELVTILGGTIKAESAPGQGTTFNMLLPFHISSEADPAPAHDEAALLNGQLPDMRVLTIEDNVINQQLITGILKEWDIRTDIASNGRDALTQLQQKDYDLILMDIQMPEMDGYTAFRKIREELEITTPVIAMTAHAFEHEKQKCLALGMDGYISKPVQISELLKLLQQFAGKGGRVKEHTATVDDSPFKYIKLGYMRSVSQGDQSYESEVSLQFIEQVNKDLHNMETALQHNDLATLRKQAHNMYTTISVVELNDQLDPLLSEIIHDTADRQRLQDLLATIREYCQHAIAETRAFLERIKD